MFLDSTLEFGDRVALAGTSTTLPNTIKLGHKGAPGVYGLPLTVSINDPQGTDFTDVAVKLQGQEPGSTTWNDIVTVTVPVSKLKMHTPMAFQSSVIAGYETYQVVIEAVGATTGFTGGTASAWFGSQAQHQASGMV